MIDEDDFLRIPRQSKYIYVQRDDACELYVPSQLRRQSHFLLHNWHLFLQSWWWGWQCRYMEDGKFFKTQVPGDQLTWCQCCLSSITVCSIPETSLICFDKIGLFSSICEEATSLHDAMPYATCHIPWWWWPGSSSSCRKRRLLSFLFLCAAFGAALRKARWSRRRATTTGQPTLPTRPVDLPCKRHLNLETTTAAQQIKEDKWAETPN